MKQVYTQHKGFYRVKAFTGKRCLPSKNLFLNKLLIILNNNTVDLFTFPYVK